MHHVWRNVYWQYHTTCTSVWVSGKTLSVNVSSLLGYKFLHDKYISISHNRPFFDDNDLTLPVLLLFIFSVNVRQCSQCINKSVSLLYVCVCVIVYVCVCNVYVTRYVLGISTVTPFNSRYKTPGWERHSDSFRIRWTIRLVIVYRCHEWAASVFRPGQSQVRRSNSLIIIVYMPRVPCLHSHSLYINNVHRMCTVSATLYSD